ncbi:hypothetical protein G6N05_11345 [Flavobacterium sp. F372]|uniref:Choice-of-anchor J domain-containing protein n=1 Tax=Flavobacterium bernardetii TaxID=2813823 RepID=A0ABR7IZF5_9FLAO|nr:DUF5689 domain-containing protein [Flavobacterium bernardetii]MBC5835179.1 choice-of-anchor J domain-containing protein [Flavobacterium bernardetii]NHF70705.1 hypothetical protein [Flavobacterium bernardetii]
MKNIKLVLTTAIFATLFGCVNNDNYADPDLSGECGDLTATKTVQNIATLATGIVKSYNSTVPAGVSADDIIEAYVTSSDEGGNFYKSISMVSLDGTKGFSVPVDDYNLYTKFEPGRKVYIKMKDRYFYNNPLTNGLEIGNLFDNGAPLADEVGRLEIVQYQDIVKRSCTKVDENTLVNNLTIPTMLNDANLNKLIEITGVQFSDSNVGKTYYNSNNQIGGATNNIVSDALGNTLIVRISEFATFAAKPVPSLNGKIRGVLTKYLGGYQFMVRTENDIMLTNPRIDSAPPIVGNANVFDATLNEPFTSYAVNLSNFPKYINDADFGPRYWQVKSFGTPVNKYIEMSSFAGNGNPGVPCKTFFMVPVDFTAASTLTFKEEMRFFRGEVALKVYYIKSADYVPGSAVDRSKLTNITSGQGLNITYPGIGLSENSFNSAGIYNIPASLTGNGYFVFEYIGTDTQTTTVQIDDITIG